MGAIDWKERRCWTGIDPGGDWTLMLDGDWKEIGRDGSIWGLDIDARWGLEGLNPDGDWTSMLDGDLKDLDVVAGWGLEGMDTDGDWAWMLDGDWKHLDVDAGWGLEGLDPDGDWKGWIRMGIGRNGSGWGLDVNAR